MTYNVDEDHTAVRPNNLLYCCSDKRNLNVLNPTFVILILDLKKTTDLDFPK